MAMKTVRSTKAPLYRKGKLLEESQVIVWFVQISLALQVNKIYQRV